MKNLQKVTEPGNQLFRAWREDATQTDLRVMVAICSKGGIIGCLIFIWLIALSVLPDVLRSGATIISMRATCTQSNCQYAQTSERIETP